MKRKKKKQKKKNNKTTKGHTDKWKIKQTNRNIDKNTSKIR